MDACMLEKKLRFYTVFSGYSASPKGETALHCEFLCQKLPFFISKMATKNPE